MDHHNDRCPHPEQAPFLNETSSQPPQLNVARCRCQHCECACNFGSSEQRALSAPNILQWADSTTVSRQADSTSATEMSSMVPDYDSDMETEEDDSDEGVALNYHTSPSMRDIQQFLAQASTLLDRQSPAASPSLWSGKADNGGSEFPSMESSLSLSHPSLPSPGLVLEGIGALFDDRYYFCTNPLRLLPEDRTTLPPDVDFW